MGGLVDKLVSAVSSRRFWAAVAGVAVVFTDSFGFSLSPEDVQMIVLVIASWIVGDSLRETQLKD